MQPKSYFLKQQASLPKFVILLRCAQIEIYSIFQILGVKVVNFHIKQFKVLLSTILFQKQKLDYY